MATVREIAKQAGVSITTVSRVLNSHPSVNPQLRDRVLEIANQRRYVASAGGRGLMNLALVYVGEAAAGTLLNSPFDVAVLQGMASGMSDVGYNLMILDAWAERNPGETYSQMFHRKGIRGAVIRTYSQSRDICEIIAEEGFPGVVLCERFDNPAVSSINCDSRKSTFEAVEKLIALGHHSIAFCMNLHDDADHIDRLEAFKLAHEKHGLEIDPLMIMRVLASRESGAKVIRQVTAMSNSPSALFVADPLTAIGALTESLRRGIKVPQDLSILGYDDADMRFDTYPTMSAVCQNVRELGREACRSLKKLIDDPDHRPVRQTLNTWIEYHGSIGPGPHLNGHIGK
jgi:DNA-binding LacI/PurR family transcriptional regulator